MKTEDVTHDLFDAVLEEVLNELKPASLLTVPGIAEILREEFNNEVLERLENMDPIDYPVTRYQTKEKRAKLIGLDKFTYDVAMPQNWIDGAVDYLTGDNKDSEARQSYYRTLVFGIVWLYDEHGRIYGRPYPITSMARATLLCLPEHLYGKEIPPPTPKE